MPAVDAWFAGSVPISLWYKCSTVSTQLNCCSEIQHSA
jgi:hypothetical protein